MAQDGHALALLHDLGAVQLVLGPVAGVVGVPAGRIRHPETDGGRLLGLHRHGHEVPVGIAGGQHVVALAVSEERGADHAVPHVQGLVDAGQPVLFDVGEADHAEMQAVGVDAVPVGGILPATLADLAGVQLLMAPAEIIRKQGLLELQLIGIGERVPAPLGLRPEGNALAVALREGLQAGHVGREGEAAVTDGQRCERVQRGDVGVVASHQRRTVDLAAAARGQRQGKRQEKG